MGPGICPMVRPITPGACACTRPRTCHPKSCTSWGCSEVARIGAEMAAILESRGLREGTIGTRVRQLAARPGADLPQHRGGQAGDAGALQGPARRSGQGPGQRLRRPAQARHWRSSRCPSSPRPPRPARTISPAPSTARGRVCSTPTCATPLETPKFAMATLAYHEGIPGHHYQIAIAQELAHLPFFRRIVPASPPIPRGGRCTPSASRGSWASRRTRWTIWAGCVTR